MIISLYLSLLYQLSFTEHPQIVLAPYKARNPVQDNYYKWMLSLAMNFLVAKAQRAVLIIVKGFFLT